MQEQCSVQGHTLASRGYQLLYLLCNGTAKLSNLILKSIQDNFQIASR
jgi:hypothetical protein